MKNVATDNKGGQLTSGFAASGGQVYRHGNPPPDSKPPTRYLQAWDSAVGKLKE